VRKTFFLIPLISALFFSVSLLSIKKAFAFSDSTETMRATVLVIPYAPAMHLSDSDPDIAEGSQMELGEIRAALRKGIVEALNKNFKEVYDIPVMRSDFTNEENSDLDILYHSLQYSSENTKAGKGRSVFAKKDSSVVSKNSITNERTFINVQVNDETLIPDFAQKFNADYFIFLNELDIKTHTEDCINLAMKNYRRDFKIHYTIFDKTGKQIHGDVAVSHFESNANDVKEIIDKNFPAIANYILQSLNTAIK
jgi:hypothetical protein